MQRSLRMNFLSVSFKYLFGEVLKTKTSPILRQLKLLTT